MTTYVIAKLNREAGLLIIMSVSRERFVYIFSA